MICECCGKKLSESSELKALAEINLSIMERGIMLALIAAMPRKVDMISLVDRIYSGSAKGGASDPEQVIRVVVSRMRKKLAPYGWTVANGHTGQANKARYYLERIRTNDT